MKQDQVEELLYQALETELGGEQIYLAAIACARNPELRDEWQQYLAETREHQRILKDVFATIGLDPDVETPGRLVVRHKAGALITAMEMASTGGGPAAAELVAAECVVEAETKDHQNWELIGRVGDHADGDLKKSLREAYEEVGDQEAEHLFHTRGWARELWIDSLGLEAALPPPEEEKNVTTMIGAGRAEHQREDYIER